MWERSCCKPRLGQLSKKAQSTPRPGCLLTTSKAQLLKEPGVVKELGGVKYQRITRVKQLVFTRLMQIQIWHWY